SAPFRLASPDAAARAAVETCGRRDGRRAPVAGGRPARRRVRRPLACVGGVVGCGRVGARRVGRGARRWHALPARPRSTDRRERAIAERRSEEHTSELQSLAYLVCRLLLEKKKYIMKSFYNTKKQII